MATSDTYDGGQPGNEDTASAGASQPDEGERLSTLSEEADDAARAAREAEDKAAKEATRALERRAGALYDRVNRRKDKLGPRSQKTLGELVALTPDVVETRDPKLMGLLEFGAAALIREDPDLEVADSVRSDLQRRLRDNVDALMAGLGLAFVLLVAATVAYVWAFGDPVSVTPPGQARPQVTTPEFRELRPAEGVAGSRVVIAGSRLTPLAAVRFGGATVPADITSDGLTAVVVVPDEAASATLVAVLADGTELDTGLAFTVITDPRATIIDTSEGGLGDEVVLRGVLLDDVSGVVFAGEAYAPAEAKEGGTSLRTTVPEGARSGPLTLATSDDRRLETELDYAIVTEPQVRGIRPLDGAVGDTVVLSGIRLREFGEVLFGGGVSARAEPSATGTMLRTIVPAGATSGPLTLQAADGTAVETGLEFTVLTQPRLRSIRPSAAGVGELIQLEGTLMQDIVAVVFANDARTGVGPTRDANAMSARVPPNAASGPLTIALRDGTRLPTDVVFELVSGAQVREVRPSEAGIGDTVVLRGVGLDAVHSIGFGGGAVAPAQLSPDGTSVRVIVPEGAQSGELGLTLADGSRTGSGFAFTLVSDAAPTPTPRPVTDGGTGLTDEDLAAIGAAAAANRGFRPDTQCTASSAKLTDETAPTCILGMPVQLLIIVLAFGAAGAMASLMIRIPTFSSIRGRSRREMFLVGFTRPILGILFGAFVFVVVGSGLIPIDIDSPALAYAALAFVAGFSERFAPDIASRTESTVLGATDTTAAGQGNG